MEQPILQIIGVLHGDITSREDAPKNFDESDRIGTLEIYPEYLEKKGSALLSRPLKSQGLSYA